MKHSPKRFALGFVLPDASLGENQVEFIRLQGLVKADSRNIADIVIPRDGENEKMFLVISTPAQHRYIRQLADMLGENGARVVNLGSVKRPLTVKQRGILFARAAHRLERPSSQWTIAPRYVAAAVRTAPMLGAIPVASMGPAPAVSFSSCHRSPVVLPAEAVSTPPSPEDPVLPAAQVLSPATVESIAIA